MMAKKMRLTGAQIKALRHIASGRSARGHVHASTYWSLVRQGLISDPETITIAGLQALEKLDAKQPNQDAAATKDVKADDGFTAYGLKMLDAARGFRGQGVLGSDSMMLERFAELIADARRWRILREMDGGEIYALLGDYDGVRYEMADALVDSMLFSQGSAGEK